MRGNRNNIVTVSNLGTEELVAHVEIYMKDKKFKLLQTEPWKRKSNMVVLSNKQNSFKYLFLRMFPNSLFLRVKFNVNTEAEVRLVVGDGFERASPIWSVAIVLPDNQEIRSEKMLLRYRSPKKDDPSGDI